MTVAQLSKALVTMPKDAVVVLAVEVNTLHGNRKKKGDEEDDSYTVDKFATNVTLRPDLRVQIGDEDN